MGRFSEKSSCMISRTLCCYLQIYLKVFTACALTIWAWTDSFFFCARAGMTGMFKKDIIRIAVNHKCRYAANGKEGNKSENMSCNQLIGIVGTPPFLREWMPLVSFPPSKTNFFNIHSRLFYLLRDNKLVVVFFCNCTEESQIGKSQLLVWWYNKMEKRK